MVHDRAELVAAIDEFETTLHRSASLARDNFEGRKLEAITLRRKIADHRTAISSLIATALADTDLQSTFRSQFSKLCAAIAFHQASWPVISIDLESPEYQASISDVRAAYAAFFHWARQALALR